MRRGLHIAMASLLALLSARGAKAQTPAAPQTQIPAAGQTIDGIAARIEDDIITESEVRELARFQQLVDGKSQARDQLINELADQWMVGSEAANAQFAHPPAEEVDAAVARLEKKFPSAEVFRARLAELGLDAAAVRRILESQMYLARFLDYKFRPTTQVDDAQIEKYYREEFTPQMEKSGQKIPPLEAVSDQIRELLTVQAINLRSAQWLTETRARLHIDAAPEGAP
ncbi:MAG: hypothetical protein ACRD50_03905 [Candidatus Acidiferrales bacterium]